MEKDGDRRETRLMGAGGGLMDDGELVDSKPDGLWMVDGVDSRSCGFCPVRSRPVDVAKTGVEQPIGPSQGYSPRSCG